MSPKTGRFLGRDPIGYEDSLNIYSYLGGNVFALTDPSGLCAVDCCGCKGSFKATEFEWQRGIGAPAWIGVTIRLEFVPDNVDPFRQASSCGCDSLEMVQLATTPPYPFETFGERPMYGPYIDARPFGGPLTYPNYNGSGGTTGPWAVRDGPRRPRREGNPEGMMYFETCAVCLKKDCPPSILGCTHWGFKFNQDPNQDELIPPHSMALQPSTKFISTLGQQAPNYNAKVCDFKKPELEDDQQHE